MNDFEKLFKKWCYLGCSSCKENAKVIYDLLKKEMLEDLKQVSTEIKDEIDRTRERTHRTPLGKLGCLKRVNNLIKRYK